MEDLNESILSDSEDREVGYDFTAEASTDPSEAESSIEATDGHHGPVNGPEYGRGGWQ